MNTEIFWISVVYASCDHVQRRLLWQHLVEMDIPPGMPWIVVGHFNSILCSAERKGGTIPSMVSMEDFGDFVNQMGLIDGRFTGNMFTWCDSR